MGKLFSHHNFAAQVFRTSKVSSFNVQMSSYQCLGVYKLAAVDTLENVVELV